MIIKYFPHHAKYEVALSSEIISSNIGESTLTYDIEIKHIKSEGATHFIEVSKTNIIINDEEVQDAFNDVLLITSEAISRIVFRINNDGTVIGFDNFEEIKIKWNKVRRIVESQYKGDDIITYLNVMQATLESPAILWKAIRKSFFFTVFFNGIYKKYPNMECIQQEMIIRDLFDTQAVSVLVDQTISINNEDDTSTLSMKGLEYFDEITEQTKAIFIKKQMQEDLPDNCLIEVEGDYIIGNSTSAIHKIIMDAKLTYGTFYQKNMHLRITKQFN